VSLFLKQHGAAGIARRAHKLVTLRSLDRNEVLLLSFYFESHWYYPRTKASNNATSTRWQSWAFIIGLVYPDSSIWMGTKSTVQMYVVGRDIVNRLMRSGTPLLPSLYGHCSRSVGKPAPCYCDSGSSHLLGSTRVQLIVSGTLAFNFELKSLQTRRTCCSTVLYTSMIERSNKVLVRHCRWPASGTMQQRFAIPSPKMKRSKYK
jgi:hypothetical protein